MKTTKIQLSSQELKHHCCLPDMKDKTVMILVKMTVFDRFRCHSATILEANKRCKTVRPGPWPPRWLQDASKSVPRPLPARPKTLPRLPKTLLSPFPRPPKPSKVPPGTSHKPSKSSAGPLTTLPRPPRSLQSTLKSCFSRLHRFCMFFLLTFYFLVEFRSLP